MLHPINQNGSKKYSSISYDGYDYSTFWQGRTYEDLADKIAVSRLLSRIPLPHDRIADIGASIGRMLPMYEEEWKECILVEPYKHQLDRAMENTTHPEKIKCIVGAAEKIPLSDASVDTVLCIRVFHYILNPTIAIQEMQRILIPGGHLVLEMPSKLHFKSRIVSFFKGNHAAVVSAIPMNQTKKDFIFVNHNPKTIRAMLNENGFEIITILSVSNFRSRLLKRIIPAKFILFLEKALQKPLAAVWFGPSIYFFARKKWS